MATVQAEGPGIDSRFNREGAKQCNQGSAADRLFFKDGVMKWNGKYCWLVKAESIITCWKGFGRVVCGGAGLSFKLQICFKECCKLNTNPLQGLNY